MAVLFSWSSVPFFCLYAQSFAGLNPTIVNPGCFGFSLGSSCVCINFARKGELLKTILSSVAQKRRNAGGSPFCVLFLQSSLYDLSDPCIDTQTGCSGCRLDLHLLSFRKNHRDSVICLCLIFPVGACSCFCISIRHYISPFLTNIITQKTIMNKYKNACKMYLLVI